MYHGDDGWQRALYQGKLLKPESLKFKQNGNQLRLQRIVDKSRYSDPCAPQLTVTKVQ